MWIYIERVDMGDELKTQIIDVLKDPKKRHKLEKALAKSAGKQIEKAACKTVKKLQKVKEKAQENWPEVKQHLENAIKETPEKLQTAKNGVVKAAKFVGKTAINFKDWALKNNTNKALVMAALMALTGETIYLTTQQSREMKKAQKEEKMRLQKLDDKIAQKHKIDSKESFAQLFDEALPLVQSSFLSSEVFVPTAYTDNNKTVNTVGAGCYWYPVDGNPESSEWILTSEYIKKHPGTKVDGDQAMALIKGWFCSREGGRVYKKMCQKLQGCELSINELVAICGVMYNSESAGFALCDFVRENYKDPIKVASYIASLRPKNGAFNDGIHRRHTAEALIYLNKGGMAKDVCAWRVKRVGKNYITAISTLSLDDCQKLEETLAKGDDSYASELSNKMSHWLCRYDGNGQPAFRQVQKEVNDTAIVNAICAVSGDTLNVTGDSPYWGDILYNQAREFNECGKYDEAAKCYDELFDKGFYGADLCLDAARNCYDLGDYGNCCKLCKAAFNNTVETHQAQPACELAAKSYEKMGKTAEAVTYQRKADSLRLNMQQRQIKHR